MRWHCRWVLGLATVASLESEADLLNVEAGGSIEIYSAYYTPFFADADRTIWPASFLPGRAIGMNGTGTYVQNDGHGNSIGFVEQRTRLHVRAAFTRDVSAFVELDSVWAWGEEFRSDYVTGSDNRGLANAGDPALFQSYIEARDVWGYPVRVRAGRQVLSFGDEWLVGSNPDPDPYIAVSFDALRLTAEHGPMTLDVWAAQLAETSPREQDGDVWFYGVYSSWAVSEAMDVDVYYLFLRDAGRINDTDFAAPLERVEDLFNLDDYDPTAIHTVGLRVAGALGNLDFRGEVAYQWGDAGRLGSQFRPFLYGDDAARYDTWGGVFEAGYTFETRFAPRMYVGGHYFGADDNRALSLGEWLSPFHRPEASVAFNRLFSSYRSTHFLDYSALSNFWLVRAGVELAFTDRFSAGFDVMYHEAVEPFDVPAHFHMGPFRVPIAPGLPFLTREGADDLGVEIMFAPEYRYSDDLTFSMQFVYYVVGEAFADGVFYDQNGTVFMGGSGGEDAASVSFLARLEF